MALTRWQLTGLGLVVVATVAVAGVALATAGTALVQRQRRLQRA